MLHVLAGPNGSGKSTLYEGWVRRSYPEVEFVNPDRLSQAELGRPARTTEEAQRGQQLAEQRRGELMKANRSLVVESTFSHPSRLDMLKEARAAGYEVRVYHVNVANAELSVQRVRSRVETGGHDVPEGKIRERYERNQALIRDAVRMADKAFVFDNSRRGEPPVLALQLSRGQVVQARPGTPEWARKLYADDLQRHEPKQWNSPLTSFQAASKMARETLGKDTRVHAAQPGGRSSGEVIARTDSHVVQQVAPKVVVIHAASQLPRVPLLGEKVGIQHSKDRSQPAQIEAMAKPKPMAPARDEIQQRLEALRKKLSPADGKALDGMVDALRSGRRDEVNRLLKDSPALRGAVGELMKGQARSAPRPEPTRAAPPPPVRERGERER